MSGSDTSDGAATDEVNRRYYRKRRALWKRKQFWVIVVSIVVSIMVALWLISNLSGHHGEVD
jgi:hypothetical protein